MTIINRAVRPDASVVVIDDVRLRDDRCLQALYEEIVDQLGGDGIRHLLLDLVLVQGITSAGLSMLVRIKNTCDGKGIALHLCQLGPAVAEVFQRTELRKLFRIHASVADVLGAI